MGQQIVDVKSITRSGILTSAGTAAVANTARCYYKINNLGQNPLFVKEGASASTSDFDHVLAAGTGDDNGTGAVHESPAITCYQGIITVAGTTPRFSITEYNAL